MQPSEECVSVWASIPYDTTINPVFAFYLKKKKNLVLVLVLSPLPRSPQLVRMFYIDIIYIDGQPQQSFFHPDLFV